VNKALQRTFSDLVGKYCDNDILAGWLWEEIVTGHSEPGRHYHTLAHLEFMLDALDDTGEHDADAFLDADLSSGLARPQEAHREVSKQIRQEYAAYPDAVFNAGRAQIIRHFLEMPRIFKTPGFHARFERQARENLQTELACLIHVDVGGNAS
jgi:predicted metal-dependent HD superfamily phosphohydrolase